MIYYFFALLLVASPSYSWACAACGCTLSPNWMDSSEQPFRLDFRYDYINQNQLRSGTSTVSSGAASQKMNDGNPQEVESYTKNNYLTMSGEYTIDPSWKMTLVIPYVIRSHSTLGTASDGVTAGPGGGEYTSNTSNLGDIRLLGRFQGFTEDHDFGIVFGVKLPTGPFDLTGTSTDPTAPGSAPIDRGLQPGTGTTDIIFGAYIMRALNKNWDYFSEAFYQSALNSRDEYRPGDGTNFNVGTRYLGFESVIPQLQINARYVQHDTGANSDRISTGGTLIYLSPGMTVPMDSKMEFYAFLQLPVYQNLLGVQLAPMYTASLGARYNF